MHTGRANGGEQGEEKGKNKGRIRMRPYAKLPSKVEDSVREKGKLNKVAASPY